MKDGRGRRKRRRWNYIISFLLIIIGSFAIRDRWFNTKSTSKIPLLLKQLFILCCSQPQATLIDPVQSTIHPNQLVLVKSMWLIVIYDHTIRIWNNDKNTIDEFDAHQNGFLYTVTYPSTVHPHTCLPLTLQYVFR